MLRSTVLILLIVMGLRGQSFSQISVADSAAFIPYFTLEYGGYTPGADLGDRFGYINFLGAAFAIKTHTNFTFGLQGGMQFGDRVKENNMLYGMRTSRGDILDDNAIISTVLFLNRGFQITGQVGKIWAVRSINPNTGFHLNLGLGYSSNWIRIENRKNTIPQLSEELKKYYDRRKHGLLFTQYIGFKYFSDQGLANFHAGFEFMQGFNSEFRTYNIDDKSVVSGSSLDLYFGFKVGWSIMFRKTLSTAYYYD